MGTISWRAKALAEELGLKSHAQCDDSCSAKGRDLETIQEALDKAAALEREACAKLAEEVSQGAHTARLAGDNWEWVYNRDVAAAIRERK
jgi:heterodisulfide reductase subunit B